LASITTKSHCLVTREVGRRPASALGVGDLEVVTGRVELATTGRSTSGRVNAVGHAVLGIFSTGDDVVGTSGFAVVSTVCASESAGKLAILDARGALAAAGGRDDNALHVDLTRDVVGTEIILATVAGEGELKDTFGKDTRHVPVGVGKGSTTTTGETGGGGKGELSASLDGQSNKMAGLGGEHAILGPAENSRVLVGIIGKSHLHVAAAGTLPDLIAFALGTGASELLKNVGFARVAWGGGLGCLLGGSLGSAGGLGFDLGSGRGGGLYFGSSRCGGRCRCGLALSGEDLVPLLLGDLVGCGLVVDGVTDNVVPGDSVRTSYVSTRLLARSYS
jgi:hypothetical protein